MELFLEDIGRRFNQEWIFKGINYSFVQGQSYAILGPNGSGKSTLLQVLAGSLTPSKGIIRYTNQEQLIEPENIYQHLAIAAPYLELIEEFTLRECIHFHYKFKKMMPEWDSNRLIELLQLERSADKEIRYYSSGMKQRVKLLLACCTDSPMLLLDEPTANLDSQGMDWYLSMVKQFTKDRLLIICSNQVHEYEFCDHHFNLLNYK